MNELTQEKPAGKVGRGSLYHSAKMHEDKEGHRALCNSNAKINVLIGKTDEEINCSHCRKMIENGHIV